MTFNSSLKMSNLNGFVDNYLAYLLARTSHLISNEFHAVVESNGLSLLEWRVMASLFGKKALSVGNLAEIILAKQPTVSKLVGRMEKSGWVKRYDSPHDKRQSMVCLTISGQRKVKPLLAQALCHEERIKAQIGVEKFNLLKQILVELIK